MTYQIKCVVGIIVFLFFSTSNLLSQSLDYSVERLISDIQQQQYEGYVRNCKQVLVEMERDDDALFNESLYVNTVSILAQAYVITGYYGSADSLLTHAIDFLSETNNNSDIYELYLAKGALFYRLADYYRAESFFLKTLNLIDIQFVGPEYYATVLSMLSVCYRSLNMMDEAKRTIEEAIEYIDESTFLTASVVAIYQKAVAVYYDLGLYDMALQYAKKTYTLSKDDGNNNLGFFNSATDLAILYTNLGRYQEALNILHGVEKIQLSDLQMARLYQNIFQNYYFLNNENETARYVKKCSNSITNGILHYFYQLPVRETERLWNADELQLRVNLGVLDKFPNNKEIIEMCYNNTLFVKTLNYEQTAMIRQFANDNNHTKRTLDEIQDLKERIFAGEDSLFYELDIQEKVLLNELNSSSVMQSYRILTWEDVQSSLVEGECAVEMVSYGGFPATEFEEKPLYYGAIILKPGEKSPIFVELCPCYDLFFLVMGAFWEKEVGINDLYQNELSDSLYNKIWRKIEEYTNDVETIYVSPCLIMQRLNLGYIKRPDGSYINEKYNIHTVASTKDIIQRKARFEVKDAVVYGGIDYGTNESGHTHASPLRSSILETENERAGYGFLRGTMDEIDTISKVFVNNNVSFDSYNGISATEQSFRDYDNNSPSIVHIATHGYYYNDETAPSYFKSFIPYSITDNSLLYSGLLFAGANNINDSLNARNDGVLTAEEISWMNLSNTELVTLSACLTGWGMPKQEGFGGLIRAFKSAGVRYIMASLWDVPDKPTAKLMTLFYKNLFSGLEIHDALLCAQREMAKEYPDPYYWAAFIIIE